MLKVFFLICICQIWLRGADPSVFDVASIRPHASDDNRFLVRPPRTGLRGLYDFSLQWDDAPIREGGVPGLDAPAAPGTDHGSIFTAIQDQLGLRLEPQRDPIEVIVVDRIERPTQN